jgi:hypothetical protein
MPGGDKTGSPPSWLANHDFAVTNKETLDDLHARTTT